MDEMAVAVHIGVCVVRRVAEQVEGVFPAVRLKYSDQDEAADDDGVPDELVLEDGLEEKRQKCEGEDLGEYDDVELFDVFEKLVVEVAGERLAEDAAYHHDGEKDELNDGESGELREPVGGFPHG
jgi:hypothetical protein